MMTHRIGEGGLEVENSRRRRSGHDVHIVRLSWILPPTFTSSLPSFRAFQNCIICAFPKLPLLRKPSFWCCTNGTPLKSSRHWKSVQLSQMQKLSLPRFSRDFYFYDSMGAVTWGGGWAEWGCCGGSLWQLWSWTLGESCSLGIKSFTKFSDNQTCIERFPTSSNWFRHLQTFGQLWSCQGICCRGFPTSLN